MQSGFAQGYRDFRYQNYERFARWAHGHELAVNWGMAFSMAVLTGLLAQIIIPTPLSPVPYTGQVLGIALMGGLLGRKWGSISALLYLGMGLIGAPVFAGQMSQFSQFSLFSGWAALTGFTGGYLIAFVPQAYLIGWIRDRRSEGTDKPFVLGATITGLAVSAFILLDAYALSQAQHTRYYAGGVQSLFLAVLVLGEFSLIGALAWLALTSKARRERIELFMGNILGLALVYTVGAIVFYAVFTSTVGAIGFMATLRAAILPFIPADITKILIAIGVLTLFRPTQREILSRQGAA